MSSPAPRWRTGALWGVLAVLLVFGAVGCATLAYGAWLVLAGDPWGIVAGIGGAFGAALAFLFTAGILYRVDRYRGTPMRTVRLFE